MSVRTGWIASSMHQTTKQRKDMAQRYSFSRTDSQSSGSGAPSSPKTTGNGKSQTKQDVELARRAKRLCEKITEDLYIMVNEPILGCYRLQEHVHKSSPAIVQRGIEQKTIESEMQGTLYDTDYSLSILKTMGKQVGSHLENMEELMKNCIFLKQQLNYRQSKAAAAETSVGFNAASTTVQLRTRDRSNFSDASSSDAAGAGDGSVRSRLSFGRKALQRLSASFDIPTFSSSASGSATAEDVMTSRPSIGRQPRSSSCVRTSSTSGVETSGSSRPATIASSITGSLSTDFQELKNKLRDLKTQ